MVGGGGSVGEVRLGRTALSLTARVCGRERAHPGESRTDEEAVAFTRPVPHESKASLPKGPIASKWCPRLGNSIS